MHARTARLVVATSLMLTFAGAAGARAQQPSVPQPIANAAAFEGSAEPVTFAGRASVASGKLQARVLDIAIQDSTGGLRVFSRTARVTVQAGDSVVASGQVKRYRGDLELVASQVQVVPGARRPVPARSLPADATLIGRYAGQLVRVSGRVVRSGFSEGGQWLRLRGRTDGRVDSVTVWVPANHSGGILFGALQPNDSLVATGIVTAYRDNADDPVVWQIVPRDAADIVVARHTRPVPAWLRWAVLVAAIGIAALALVGRHLARRQVRALRETDARYRQLLALTPDAVIVHTDGRVLFANPAAAQLLGAPDDATLVGRPLADFLHTDSAEVLPAVLSPEEVHPGEATRIRARLRSADGTTAEVEITASPCVYHTERAVVMLARDITAQLRYERDLHALALVDELTGLQNRRGFTLFAEQELARARRHGRVPVLVFADLDGLKHINDSHGHAAGDAALRLAGRALRSILRETDIVARWSGDEFVALMGEGGEVAAESIGERLDAALAALAPAGQEFTVTASVGTSTLDPELPLADAMERADAELYAQKKRERRSLLESGK